MELLFRKYFWAINLAFLALAAFLLARTANTFVGAAIGPAPSGTAAPAAKPGLSAPKIVGTAALSPDATARLFGIVLPEPEPVAEVEEEAPITAEELANQSAVRSSLAASLIGTMVANRPQWSFATLRDDGSKDVGVYMVGDRFMGAEVLEIDRLRVIILNENRKEYIALGEDPAPASLPVAKSTPVAPPRGGEAEGITKLDENRYEIARSTIDEQLSNLNNIATQARIVPSFKDGVANGFKLFSIRPGSLYSQIGIQNGDVIRRINGYEINSPDKALEVYSKLKESSKIEIDLERRGQPLKKTYTIR
jgi:general secretion pathway protein C